MVGPVVIRQAVPDDAAAIAQVEAASWPPAMAASLEQVSSRIAVYAAGQWLAERDGKIIGWASAQRITQGQLQETPARFDRLTDEGRLTRSHQDQGDDYQLLGVGVLPEARGERLGRQVVDRQIAAARELPGIRRIVGFTRPAGFHRYPESSIEEYLVAKSANGRWLDPMIAFHVGAGARIVSIHPDFRPADTQARGYGVLIEYPVAISLREMQH